MLLIAALAGAALGAGPGVGAKHRRARLVATKTRAHGHVPKRLGRPPLTGTVPGTTTPTTPTTPTTTDPPPPPACPTALGVSEGEYYTSLSRTALCPGRVRIELRNTGEDPHNLVIEDLGDASVVATWDDAGPGDVAAKQVTLGAGTYKLFCALPDHELKGMHAVITVG